ncbi:MAG: hypothetical protein AAGF87_07065, partial [Bacteroidota bacterium]
MQLPRTIYEYRMWRCFSPFDLRSCHFALPQVVSTPLVLAFLVLIPIVFASAQTVEELRVDSDFTADRLVREVFASGTCETISGITAIGNEDGIG